jgi:antitoxin MazE
MKISRWGNSLGVRLPASVVEALGLAEGDEIEIDVVGARAFEVRRRAAPRELVERLRRLRGTLPADIRFDRLDAQRRIVAPRRARRDR